MGEANFGPEGLLWPGAKPKRTAMSVERHQAGAGGAELCAWHERTRPGRLVALAEARRCTEQRIAP